MPGREAAIPLEHALVGLRGLAETFVDQARHACDAFVGPGLRVLSLLLQLLACVEVVAERIDLKDVALAWLTPQRAFLLVFRSRGF